MTFTIKLERVDGTPAEPPSIKTGVTNWRPGDTIPIGRRHSASFAFATTMQTSLRYWSLRTWLEERLAPRADIS
jgi:hypothetical protein